MKSVAVVVLPIALAVILAGLFYMYKTGMVEKMLSQTETETASSQLEETGDGDKAAKPDNIPKLADVDTSTPAGLSQARDIVRTALEAKKREELKRLQMESKETEKKKRLNKSMDGWLKRTD